MGNFDALNTKKSKEVVDQMGLCPMRELIFDHGSAFGAHRLHENGKWDGDFKQPRKIWYKANFDRDKASSDNGKLERFFGEYKRHRHVFLHSKSLRNGITIDRMETWSSKGLKPGKGISKEDATGSVLSDWSKIVWVVNSI